MRLLFDRLERVAPTESTVLITGETGVGKELVARAVHTLSPRRARPFLAVNCAALAEGILESELFGHVRGAFTGAARDRAGVFEAAEGGTLFLDEIGATTAALQSRLLRALEEHEVTQRWVPPSPRESTSASWRPPIASCARWWPRSAFAKISIIGVAVFPLMVPPLRDRASDIPILVEHALSRLRTTLPSAKELSISPLAMRLLRRYSWPGNVRQLFAALESAAITARGGRIEGQDLPDDVRGAHEADAAPRYRASASADDERVAIEAALEQAAGSVSRAAELLGMGRTTLWRKMRAHGLGTAVPNEP